MVHSTLFCRDQGSLRQSLKTRVLAVLIAQCSPCPACVFPQAGLPLLPVRFLMVLFQRPTASTDLENNDTGVNSKPKSHVTIRRAVLEEIGNRVTTRAIQVAKVTTVRAAPLHTRLTLQSTQWQHRLSCPLYISFSFQKAQNTKVPVPPTKTTNVNKHPKPTASVKPVQMDVLAPKVGNSEFTSILNRVASLGLWCKGTFIVTVTFEEH